MNTSSFAGPSAESVRCAGLYNGLRKATMPRSEGAERKTIRSVGTDAPRRSGHEDSGNETNRRRTFDPCADPFPPACGFRRDGRRLVRRPGKGIDRQNAHGRDWRDTVHAMGVASFPPVSRRCLIRFPDKNSSNGLSRPAHRMSNTV